jgi:hypothetical protein
MNVELMYSNNPLSGDTICFDCINTNLLYSNLEHADFFCRTYNLPFNPQLWIELSNTYGPQTFREYTVMQLSDEKNQPNLYYSSSTRDV